MNSLGGYKQRMYKILTTINDKIQKTCEVGGVLLLILVFSLTALRIVSRQVSLSLSWPGQVAQYLLVVAVFLALPLLFRTKEDISFRPLLENVPYDTKRRLYLLGDGVLIILFLFIAISATQAAQFQWGVGLSSVRWLRIGYVYVFIGAMTFVTILPVLEEMIAYWIKAEETMDRSLTIADIADDTDE